MARGGYRPGAGRPKGSGRVKVAVVAAAKPKRLPGATIAEARKLPLAYMLDVMNDEGADQARRDRMAIAAAPFSHARGPEDSPGKKAQANAAAVTAQAGTSWEDILPTAPVQ